MTKKETIALRYYTALTEVNGSSFTDADVTYLAKHRPASWLEEKAEEAENKLAAKREADSIKEYFESEEGKKAMEVYKSYAEVLQDELNEAEEAASNTMSDVLKKMFGNDAKVVIWCDQAEIGIADPEGKFRFKFGHSFNVYFKERLDWDREANKCVMRKPVPEINFGTMGSYKPSVDVDYCRYIKMLSEFSNNAELMNLLCTLIANVTSEGKAISKKFEVMRNWKSNPLKTPFPWAEYLNVA